MKNIFKKKKKKRAKININWLWLGITGIFVFDSCRMHKKYKRLKLDFAQEEERTYRQALQLNFGRDMFRQFFRAYFKSGEKKNFNNE